VITIAIPPLRERGDDILLLANYFVNKFANESGKTPLRFSDKALQALKNLLLARKCQRAGKFDAALGGDDGRGNHRSGRSANAHAFLMKFSALTARPDARS